MMKDMIDKRNERERIARSIIKYWNVNYIPRTQADSGMQKQTAEAENAQDQTMDPNMQEDYNKATNAYSGKYGQEKDLDEVTKDQIDKILHEKAEHIHQLFEKFGFDEVFGRTAVMDLLNLKKSGASKLLSKLVQADIIKQVPGLGKGKYKFKNE